LIGYVFQVNSGSDVDLDCEIPEGAKGPFWTFEAGDQIVPITEQVFDMKTDKYEVGVSYTCYSGLDL